MEQSDFNRAERSYSAALGLFDAICTSKIDLTVAELIRAYQIADEWCTLLSDSEVVAAVYSRPSGRTIGMNFHMLFGPKRSEIFNRCPDTNRYVASLNRFLQYRGALAAKVSEKMSIVWNVVSQFDFSGCDEDEDLIVRKDRSLRRAKLLFNQCNKIPGLKAEFDIALIDPLYDSTSVEEDIAAYWNAFSQIGTELCVNKPSIRLRFNKAILSVRDFLAECQIYPDQILQDSLERAMSKKLS